MNRRLLKYHYSKRTSTALRYYLSEYQSVRRFVRKLRGAQGPEAHPVIVTAPGEEGQVDYGTGPMVRDPQSGKYRRTRLFVMTLGYPKPRQRRYLVAH